MVKGDNKGHKYEKKIVEILQNKDLMPKEISGAGSGPGVDAIFIHKGKQYSVEVKDRANGGEFGQKRLIPKFEKNSWKWYWSEKKKDLKITKHYTSLGVLEHLNDKQLIPNKFRKPDHEITYDDVKEDQKNFEENSFKISDDLISMFYQEKADYIQIGNGYGLYHTKEDKAKLGTEKLSGDFYLRFRAKRHHSIPYYCYSFIAVIKCRSLSKKSNYNLEDTDIQKFPGITP